MSISSAKEVIKKLLAYQNEYDECPNVTWIPPKKSLSEKTFHKRGLCPRTPEV